MKTKLIIGFLALGLILVGCQKETSTTTTTTSNNVSTGGSTGGGTGSTGGSTGGTIGSSCSGTPQDGTGPGNSLWHFDLQMAGHQTFYPGILDSNESSQWGLMNITEGRIAFQSDSRLKVRFKIHPQPVAPNGQEYCYGRETGQPSDAFRYTKVKFTVYLRDVLEHNVTKELVVGNRYQPRYIGPVSASSCSPIIDYSSSRNLSSQDPNYTLVSNVIEIDDVRSDSNCQECQDTNCQYENFYCPAESIIRAASCWRMTLQISTDSTQDFY